MSYSTSNPPARLVTGPIGSGLPSIWVYRSADIVSAVRVANYFTNGNDLGMLPGDIVIVQVTSTWVTSLCIVMAATPVNLGPSPAAAVPVDLSDGTSISVTNTD